MKKYSLLIILAATLFSCVDEDRSDTEAIIEYYRQIYAPDKRVALFDIQWQEGQLSGETNMPEALNQLKDSLAKSEIKFQDSVAVLPDASLDGKHYAVVTLSVANLRSQPKHSAELATQAILGTPLSVWKKNDDWYLIQTPDQYLAWVDAAGITLMDEKQMNAWYDQEKVVFTSLLGYLYESGNEENIVSDLTAGNLLELIQEGKNHHQVQLPDGRKGYVSAASVVPYEKWITSRSTSPENLISTARSMMGSPYLWGGTSVKGMDCSGFTKTIYFLNGQIIPRDASQQIMEGEQVDREKNWDNLQVGDLLFFGVPATEDAKERVVHVGMWIGDNSFIHSRGRVRISSFDPESENYDEYEFNRYLRTQRIAGKESDHILAVNEIFKFK